MGSTALPVASIAVFFVVMVGAALAQTTVKVGITNVSTDVGFFIADKKGYFRDEGLSVTFTEFNSAAKMIAPLGAGQLDVGGGTVSAGLYNAVARKIDIKVVADKGSIRPGYGFSSLPVRKDHVDSGRYKDFSDLNFVLSQEGQELFNSMGRVPSSLKVKSNLNNFKYTMADPAITLDENDKWEKIWNDLFMKK